MRLRECDPAGLTSLLHEAAEVLVHFGTDWCPPCKRLERVLLTLLEEGLHGLSIVKVNVEDHPELARAHSVAKNPTLCFFNGVSLIAKREGFANASEILRLVGRDTD